MVVSGRHRRGADALLSRYATEPRAALVSAAHGLIEAVSAIRRMTRAELLSPDQGAAAIRWLADFELILDATTPRLSRIWSLRDRMSAYDAAYAAAAEALDASLLTVDARLLTACREAGIAARHLDELAEGRG